MNNNEKFEELITSEINLNINRYFICFEQNYKYEKGYIESKNNQEKITDEEMKKLFLFSFNYFLDKHEGIKEYIFDKYNLNNDEEMEVWLINEMNINDEEYKKGLMIDIDITYGKNTEDIS